MPNRAANLPGTPIGKKLFLVCLILSIIFVLSMLTALFFGPSSIDFSEILSFISGGGSLDPTTETILLKIRLPRIILAAVVGATLSIGGMVFQALLRNPLAEPYILGISGGSAVGAIGGILLGLSFFPGVTVFSFAGSLVTMGAILLMAGGRSFAKSDSLLLGGVMMNSFCGAIIMFLISISNVAKVQQIIFWLMGDLSMLSSNRMFILILCLPCFAVIFLLSRPLNIMLAGKEAAIAMGIDVTLYSNVLLLVTSLMVSLVVCLSGLIGFVGLLVPHLFRLILGPDHRLLGPACVLGGASYLVICDVLARTLPQQGEMPVGIITALVGAPIFIFLLWRARR